MGAPGLDFETWEVQIHVVVVLASQDQRAPQTRVALLLLDQQRTNLHGSGDELWQRIS
jgi:hypothetical protein